MRRLLPKQLAGQPALLFFTILRLDNSVLYSILPYRIRFLLSGCWQFISEVVSLSRSMGMLDFDGCFEHSFISIIRIAFIWSNCNKTFTFVLSSELISQIFFIRIKKTFSIWNFIASMYNNIKLMSIQLLHCGRFTTYLVFFFSAKLVILQYKLHLVIAHDLKNNLIILANIFSNFSSNYGNWMAQCCPKQFS